MVFAVLNAKYNITKKMRKKNNRCSINGCTENHYITYYTYPICKKHWKRHCDNPFLKKSLKIPLKQEKEVKTNETNQTLQKFKGEC